MSPFDTHRGHLEVAWQCLQQGPFEVGAPEFVFLLKAHLEAKGQLPKYHATITWAFLALMAERIAQAPGESFEQLLGRCPDLEDPTLLPRRYPGGALSSERARAAFVLPGG